MALTKKQKRSKYNVSLNDKLTHKGQSFRSKLEVNHYKEFLDNPNVEVLEFEPYFLLLDPFYYYDLEKDKLRKYGKWSYKADFLLKFKGLEKLIVWESKGMIKPEYALRRKMWYKLYGEEYYYITSKSLKHCKQVLKDLELRGDMDENNTAKYFRK
jgi:hypothetical protein